MQTLFKQIEEAVSNNLYYLALYVSLTVPDICSAMESENGIATPQKYIQWFDRYIAPKYTSDGHVTFTGKTCYLYRCSMLHQGRAQHPKLDYSRILFTEPSVSCTFHNNIINDALNIDVSIFCSDVIAGAREWHRVVEGTKNYKNNFTLFMQRHPKGLHPYIVGVPVIG